MLRSRWLALVILCTATLMIILDGTIVTVALPVIQADLGFTPASLSWVMDSYLIAFGGLLLLSGRLGDLLGRKRMFLAGLAVFTLASLACGLAAGPGMLIAARFVQGIGGAMASSVTLGMIVRLFARPEEQRQAIGAFSFVGAVGASAGLIIGGVLVQLASWHWIFFVNVPIGLLAGIAGWRLLAADRGMGLRAGADALGALLVTAGVMLGVYAIVQRAPWAGFVAVALLAGFVVRQATARTPLLPLRVFASRSVWGANLAQLFIIGAAMGFQVIVTLYMQRVLGFRPAAAGLGLFPVAAVIAAVSLGLSARLIGRFGASRVLISGLVMITAALALLTQIPARADYATSLLPLLVVFGLGGGLTLPAVTTLGMAGATDADAGLVSGVFNTAQQVGGALGLALLTTLAAARTAASPAPQTAQALTSGYHLAWAAGAVLGAAAIAVAAIALRSPRRPAGPILLNLDRGPGLNVVLWRSINPPARCPSGSWRRAQRCARTQSGTTNGPGCSRSPAGPAATTAGTAQPTWTGCCSSGARSGSGCGSPRSATCSPSATPAPAPAARPRSCCASTSARSTGRWRGCARCGPNWPACSPPCPALAARTRRQAPGAPRDKRRKEVTAMCSCCDDPTCEGCSCCG
jgi:EmrB/QacA subfamily drug resistance transporter